MYTSQTHTCKQMRSHAHICDPLEGTNKPSSKQTCFCSQLFTYCVPINNTQEAFTYHKSFSKTVIHLLLLCTSFSLLLVQVLTALRCPTFEEKLQLKFRLFSPLFGRGRVCPAPCRERNTVFLMTSKATSKTCKNTSGIRMSKRPSHLS